MNGKEMRELRISAGLKQIEVSPILGIKNTTLCRWENSGREIPKAYADVFCMLISNNQKIEEIKMLRSLRGGYKVRKRKLVRGAP